MNEGGQSRYGLIKDSGAAHWYSRDAQPQHHTNVRGARTHGYYPSVTTYLKVWPKEALDRWKIEQAIMAAITLPRKKDESDDDFAARVVVDMQQEVKDAGDIGTKLHHAMNIRLTTGNWPDDGLQEFHEAYEPWIQDEIIEVVMSEVILTNDEWGYAGTVDLVANTNTYGFAVLDFKNQNVRAAGPAFYPEWLMQLVAYQRALPDDMPDRVESIVSLVLDRNKPVAPYAQPWPVDEWDNAWAKFEACMNLWCLHKDYDPIRWTPPEPKKKAPRKRASSK